MKTVKTILSALVITAILASLFGCPPPWAGHGRGHFKAPKAPRHGGPH